MSGAFTARPCIECGQRVAEINGWCWDCIRDWQDYENEKGT